MRNFLGVMVLGLFAVACGSDDKASNGSGGSGSGATGGAGGTSGASGAGGSAGAFPTPAPSGCIDDASAGSHQFTCDGIKYDIAVPTACVTSACGLIFDVHGFSMSAAQQEANTKLRGLGDQYGYIVVQPTAPGTTLPSWTPATDDDKVFATLQLVQSVWHPDEKRIHFTGFSQGGAMTWRFICKHADLLASAAPGAEAACPFDATGTPSRELDVIYLHGTKDALVSFDNIAIPQRDAIVAGWNMDAGTVVASDASYKRTKYTSPKGTVFEFVQHDYSAAACIVTINGHCFPGSTDPGGLPGQACKFGCLPPNAFVWGEEVMKFFRDHPKKD